jgi:putative ABC transport system permease protein
MNLVGLALRNLRRRPLRTSLSIAGIALAVGSALALLALSRSIEDSTREGLAELGNDLVVAQRGATDLFGGFLPEGLQARIAGIPDVVRVTGELFLFAASERNRQVLVSGWPETSYLWKDVPLREGRLPASAERRVVLVGDAVAEVLAKGINDSLEILGEKFRIIGITKFASIVNRGTVIVPLVDLQEVTYRRGQVSMFHLNLRHGATQSESDRVKHDIAALDRLTVSTANEVLKNDRNFAVLNAVSLAISIIALTMSVLNVLNSLLMAIQERIREIGIVAAIGWSDRLIVSSLVIEGLLMCAAGCVLGVLLGYLASFLFPLIPTLGDYLNFTPTVGLILPTIAAAFVLCTIASLYPAWRAIRCTPAEALQRA